MTVFRQEVLEVSKRIINAISIPITQHYFKTYPARCQWRKIGPDAVQSIWHIAAKLSHETNLAITKLSRSFPDS